MDNFMDKLTKRFNAGEIISANGEAEARENARLKKQNEEYDKILQEVRRLNLKTVEISEQISQMAAASIEQIESYTAASCDDANSDKQEKDALLFAVENKVSQIKDTVDEIGQKANQLSIQSNNQSQQMKKEFSDASYRMEATLSQIEEEISLNRKAIENTLLQLQKELGEQNSQEEDKKKLKEQVEQILKLQKEDNAEQSKQIKEMIAGVRLYMEEVQKHIEDYVHKEDVKVYRNVQAVITQQFSDRARELNVRLDKMEASKGKGGGIIALVLITLLISSASLAMQILQMLGML